VPLLVEVPPPLLQEWVLWQPLAAFADATPDIPSRGSDTTMAMAKKERERRRSFIPPSSPTTRSVYITTFDENGPGTSAECETCCQSCQCGGRPSLAVVWGPVTPDPGWSEP
jgi:hypothetical protein